MNPFNQGQLAAAIGMLALSGIPISITRKRTPFQMPELPPGEAPEELRKPLLTGRRGKGTKKQRKQRNQKR